MSHDDYVHVDNVIEIAQEWMTEEDIANYLEGICPDGKCTNIKKKVFFEKVQKLLLAKGIEIRKLSLDTSWEKLLNPSKRK